MNEQQTKYLKTMANTLDEFLKISKRTPEDWNDAAGFIAVVVKACKGHESEARDILWSVAEKWGG